MSWEMSDVRDETVYKLSRSIVRDLDSTNELTFLRVKSLKHEVRSPILGPAVKPAVYVAGACGF